MTDLLMLGLAVAFFVLAYAFLKGCERIIGPDAEAEAERASLAVAMRQLATLQQIEAPMTGRPPSTVSDDRA